MMVARIQRTAGPWEDTTWRRVPKPNHLPRDLYHLHPYSAPLRNDRVSEGIVQVTEARRNVFVAQIPNAPTPGRDPLHDPPEQPARDPPAEPLHDPPGDPTHEPPQPRTDPTPNPASDPPRELPSGVAWC